MENRQVINVTPVVLVESDPSKDIVRCARVAVSGLSRLKLGSYSSARRITLVPSDDIQERSHNKIQICLHRSVKNETTIANSHPFLIMSTQCLTKMSLQKFFTWIVPM